MGDVALRLEEEFRAMVSIDGVDPEAAEMVAREVAKMPDSTLMQRTQRLVAWVDTMREMRALELAER